MLENEVILSIIVRQHWIVVNNYDWIYVFSATHCSNHNETIKGIVVPACHWEGRSKVDERYVAQHWTWAYWWAISLSEIRRDQALPWRLTLHTQGMKMSPEEWRLIISTHSRQRVDGRLPSSFYQLRFTRQAYTFVPCVMSNLGVCCRVTRRSFP